MFPRLILKETLIKKSQQKKRISLCNYKERLFVLDTQDLKYSDCRPGRNPRLKGCIELCRIECVEIVCSQHPIPCNYKYPFQVFYNHFYLYIFAPDSDCRQRWVSALKEATKGNIMVAKYHPDFWMDGKWRCCQQTEKLAAGCQAYDPGGSASKEPLSELPGPKAGLQDAEERTVVALHDYTPVRGDDLALQKDQQYSLINGCHGDWWAVRDGQGNTGFVPRTYVEEKSSNNFQRFKWYNKNTTRGEAEDLLMKQGKEGGFMMRDSRQTGVYTVSVFTKAPGANGEKNPRVKHYQIRQAESGEARFYVAEKYLFSTIPELIRYHQHNGAGLITRLRHPVSRDGSVSQDVADPSKDQWEVDPEQLTLGQELGSGQFGLVLEGRWRDKKVAVKTIREECMSEEEFKEEAGVMMRLSHCKLVQLYAVRTQRSPMCLVFEFMDNGCLSDFLQARRGRLSQEAMSGMCLDVSEGMAYLESSNFIHRDLAARNCLVSKNNEVKISDFGMARFVLDDQYTSSQCSKFPIRWSAPEVIKFCKFSSKSDVWSFGVLMWEVFSEGRLPYENHSNVDVVESLNRGQRLLKPSSAPDAIHRVMERCWKENPEDRPSFAVLRPELASLSHLKM
ncbi:tyrosine-protein kinase ITK/TSK [Pseudoliparis swirei]|uniref:tyrosine-protein kinase ITK/TSK n=1 Tax=Pseudoliparis swirei TaxID=2059687 RepID=UPI0024BE79D4|nr:tyrosine-protein kinase ITK/TSK [Pseudoliparis swirei]